MSTIGFLTGLCLLVYGGRARSDTLPDVYETYGDSLTVGFLSSTNITSKPSLALVDEIYNALAKWKLYDDLSYVEPYQQPPMAWPNQLAMLYHPNDSDYLVSNYAVTGNKTSDLVTQTTNAEIVRPDSQAFFFIGHNDFCNNSNSPDVLAAQYITNYKKAVAVWEQKHQGATAHFMPIGDIPRAFQTLDGYVWHPKTDDSPQLSCYDSWTRLFPYCPRYAHMQEKGQLSAYLEPRIQAANAALEAQVAVWASQSQSNKYVYLKGTDQPAYQLSYFAVDCFHLSAVGQKMLADTVYKVMGGD